MKKLIPLLILVSASLVWFGFRRQATPPDLSSPKAAVRSFVAALVAKDADGVAACVQGAQSGADLKALLEKDVGPMARVSSATVKDIAAEVNGDQAKVTVEVTLIAPSTLDREGAKVTLSVVELFQAQKQNEQWRIVPDAQILRQLSDPTIVGTRYDLRPMATMAALIGSPAVAQRAMNAARESAITTTCISNEKQIALGVLMYVQDYDEIFPRKKALYNDLIFPYVKNKAIFECPADAKGTISYTFNPNLQGAKLAEMVSPQETVLLYEGKDRKFAFKHDGKTAVAFADGHVKLLTPEQADKVFWYPGGKNPAPAKPARPQPKRRAAGMSKPS